MQQLSPASALRAKVMPLASLALVASLAISSGCGSSQTPLTPEEAKSSRIYKLANDRIENAPKVAPGKHAAKRAVMIIL